MLKKVFILLTVTALLASGCAAPANTETEGSSAVTFEDNLGRTVTVNNPKRVATLLGSFAQVWFLAGGESVAAPDDAWEDLKLPMPEDAVNLGNTKKVSLELLLSANPDFVIASAQTKANLDFKDTLENAKIPVAYFRVNGFEDYLRLLKICTQITGKAELYEKHGAAVQSQIESVKEMSSKRVEANGAPTVLSMRASAGSIRAKNSVGNVLGEILKDLGCVNIADSNSAILENLSMEYIMQSDPDFIFIVQSGDDAEGTQKNLKQFIEENPAWNQLTAVKEGKVFMVEKELYNLKPNERWGLAYEKLETILAEHQ